MRLIVTNFNPRFTGVSATVQTLLPVQAGRHEAHLCGHGLPGCPAPISLRKALGLSKAGAIWHVRRNNEMWAAIFARDVLRLPIRIVFTSAAIRRHSAMPRWQISRMDAVIAASAEAARFVANPAATIPHGVDTQRFSPAGDKAAAWAALGYGGARGVATVGRIRPEKGTDLFVDAMIEALPALPDVTALVIGRAAPEHRMFVHALEEKIRAAGLAGRIVFTGELPPERMPEAMRALSLLVALPRYEGYGLTVLEAMASGTPFVASRTGHFQDFANGGQCGEIAGPADPAADAAAKMTRMLQDVTGLDLMSANARQHSVMRYGVETEADAIDAVYANLAVEIASKLS